MFLHLTYVKLFFLSFVLSWDFIFFRFDHYIMLNPLFHIPRLLQNLSPLSDPFFLVLSHEYIVYLHRHLHFYFHIKLQLYLSSSKKTIISSPNSIDPSSMALSPNSSSLELSISLPSFSQLSPHPSSGEIQKLILKSSLYII